MRLSDYAKGLRLRMLRDFVFVEMLEDRAAVTLIVAPQGSYKRPDRARVLAAGPDSTLREGDEIVVDPYRFALVLSDGALANAEHSPYAGIGDRAVIRAEHVRWVRVEESVEESA